MLNIIWPIFIIISIIYALISGNIENSSNGIFDSMNSAVNLTITFFGTICLWNGLMEIAKKSSLIKILNKLLSPSINFLFPELKNNFQAKEEISMNIVTNFLGLGNASTPIGLQAMKTLQKDNTKKDTIKKLLAELEYYKKECKSLKDIVDINHEIGYIKIDSFIDESKVEPIYKGKKALIGDYLEMSYINTKTVLENLGFEVEVA